MIGTDKYSDYYVNIWIKVGDSYWPKPYSVTRNITINKDGTWDAKFITGGNDKSASEIVAALIPKNKYIPPYENSKVLPKELDYYPVVKELRCNS